MSFFKWLSVGVGLAGGLMAAALAVYLSAAPQDAGGYLRIFTAATGAGLALGLGHHLATGRYEAELRRLTTHVERLTRAAAEAEAPAPAQVRFGLAELADVVHAGLAGTRHRLRQAAVQRRELEAQARLSASHRRHLQALLHAVADPVLVTDAFNEIVLANPAAAQVLGFELESALHRPIDQVIHDPTLVRLIRKAREASPAARPRDVEHRLGHNGQTAVYNVSFVCIPADAGLPSEVGRSALATPGFETAASAAGVVTVLRDITHERQIAEMKSDFVSNISHELRTPLSSIRAYMEMLVDGEARDDQTRAEFYNIIQGETNRLSRLIDNILSISRIESGAAKVQREHVALPLLIREAVDIIQPQARARRIDLVLAPAPTPSLTLGIAPGIAPGLTLSLISAAFPRISPALAPGTMPEDYQVFADRDMIQQVVLNLIGNAIKYTPMGGRVEVALSVDERARRVRLSVSDTGVGIPPKDLPHLFDKFYRVADHKKLAKGTGLGLNLVKHVIETVHGGHVSVSSEIGRGSVFTFSLPIADNR